MAYRDDVQAIGPTGPTNYWPLDGNGTDLGNPQTETPTDVSANSGSNFAGAAITEDAAASFRANSGEGNCANRGYMNNYSGQPDPYGIRTFAFWVQLTDVSNPTVIWEEGGTIRNFAAWAGITNRIGMQAVSADAPGWVF